MKNLAVLGVLILGVGAIGILVYAPPRAGKQTLSRCLEPRTWGVYQV